MRAIPTSRRRRADHAPRGDRVGARAGRASPTRSTWATTSCSARARDRPGERARDSVLAGAFEAVAGAIYLEHGLEATRRLAARGLPRPSSRPSLPVSELKSPKSRLQELAYARTGRAAALPHAQRRGPGPRPPLRRRGRRSAARALGRGEGRNRRDAETEAAAEALSVLRHEAGVQAPAGVGRMSTGAPDRACALRRLQVVRRADAVEFGPGISAVVGPNGSGKSNLADALRWALGEQGRSLRTRRAEDVIFAGSSAAQAIGMADVTPGHRQRGPAAAGRLRRGRARPAALPLGRERVPAQSPADPAARPRRPARRGNLADNAFLFIGQGMVDQALALRPEERRPLFEEAAGIRRHERRRRQAEARAGRGGGEPGAGARRAGRAAAAGAPAGRAGGAAARAQIGRPRSGRSTGRRGARALARAERGGQGRPGRAGRRPHRSRWRTGRPARGGG